MPVALLEVVAPDVSVPATAFRLRPVAGLLVDERVLKLRPRPTLPSSSEGPPVAATLPPPVLTVPPPLATRPAPFAVVTASEEKETVSPVLLVRLTPVPALLLPTVVAAKERLAFELSTLMPTPAGLVMVVAPVTLTAPPPLACRNPTPLLPEVVMAPKVRVPAELFPRMMASVPPVTEVLPKLMLAVLEPTETPCVAEPETEVEPKATVPATSDSRMPCAALLVVATPLKPEVAAKVPFVRLSAWPLPPRNTSGGALLPTVSVPKLLPKILAPVVLPTLKPRRVLPWPSVTALVAAAEVVSAGRVPPVEGSASLCVGTVTVVMLASVALAPWPMSRWLLRSVLPPV